MKKIFLSGVVLLFSVGLMAQQTKKEINSAQVATELLVAKYQLSKKQAAEMLKIQDRLLRNQNQIANLKDTDLPKYLDKASNLEISTNFSIRKMLNTEQRKVFDQERHDLRTKRAKLSSQMHKEGKTPMEIKSATLEIKE